MEEQVVQQAWSEACGICMLSEGFVSGSWGSQGAEDQREMPVPATSAVRRWAESYSFWAMWAVLGLLANVKSLVAPHKCLSGLDCTRHPSRTLVCAEAKQQPCWYSQKEPANVTVSCL